MELNSVDLPKKTADGDPELPAAGRDEHGAVPATVPGERAEEDSAGRQPAAAHVR